MTGDGRADSPAGELDGLVELAQRIQSAMLNRGWTLATAESCTGGLVGYAVTEVPGSSNYYVGGLVSYSNELKEHELGVSAAVLEQHGAVSAQTALSMAEGARRRYGASLGLAVTGIAGPDGGTADKPVGLTYVAVADDAGHEVRRNVCSGDRHLNRVMSADAALRLLLERLGMAEAGA